MIELISQAGSTAVTMPPHAPATYRDVAADLSERIRAGEYEPGSKLPPYPELAELYSVRPATIKRAMVLVRDRGLVVDWPGRGIHVADPLPGAPGRSA